MVIGTKEIVAGVLIATNSAEEALKEAAINIACDLIFWLADLGAIKSEVNENM